MIVDFDDIWPGNDGMELLERLKAANPAFRVTLFAVPGRGFPSYWRSFPDWVELAVHGWLHPDPYECSAWTYERTLYALDERPEGFCRGWKSPGWQSSLDVLRALRDRDWWVADHPEGNERRPVGLRTHVLGDGDHLHGHIGWNGSGNDLAANFDYFESRVRAATQFELISEVVLPWGAQVAA